jgi:hypothetical protein
LFRKDFLPLPRLIFKKLFAYGTAYRATKKGGDDGTALFGWLLVYSMAAIIPFLGYYLWKESKK